MAAPLSVAVVGVWHVHAADYARSISEHPEATLAAVWDVDQEHGRQVAAELSTEFVDDLDALLARRDLDAIVVTTSTDLHYDVISRAASAGKHVFTEKLLAPTVGQAEELVRLARECGIALVVSLPFLSESVTLAASEIIEAGELGELTYVRVRMAHDGWVDGWLPERFANRREAIGGAMSDLGCHPAYLVQKFLGPRPTSIAASYAHTSGRAVEDNAVATATYEGGALGVFEASFVTTPGAFTIEIRGTKGTLLYGFGGQGLMAKGGSFGLEKWSEVPLPEAGADPFHDWIGHIRSGTTASENLMAAVDLTRIIVAANEAAVR